MRLYLREPYHYLPKEDEDGWTAVACATIFPGWVDAAHIRGVMGDETFFRALAVGALTDEAPV